MQRDRQSLESLDGFLVVVNVIHCLSASRTPTLIPQTYSADVTFVDIPHPIWDFSTPGMSNKSLERTVLTPIHRDKYSNWYWLQTAPLELPVA